MEVTMSATDSLGNKLANYMLEKAKKNGGKAPSERELAEHFKISRGHVRETLAVLEALKVIERRPKSGIYINDDAGGLEKMAFISQLGMPLEVRQVDELVELRKIHENKAAELAASNAVEENLLALKQILDESEATLALGGSLHNLDRSFHLEVVRATQNSLLHSLCQLYYQTSNKRLTTYFQMHERGVTSHTEHLQIFDAIARKDGMLAHSLMNAHLTGAPNYWADILQAKKTASS
jgi:GntR family transcriptional repressor for pyruvate dehydrogenase complex